MDMVKDDCSLISLIRMLLKFLKFFKLKPRPGKMTNLPTIADQNLAEIFEVRYSVKKER